MSLQSLASGKKPPLGSGARFAALKGKLEGKYGEEAAGAIAAVAGRKKYGASKMAHWASQGRKRAEA